MRGWLRGNLLVILNQQHTNIQKYPDALHGVIVSSAFCWSLWLCCISIVDINILLGYRSISLLLSLVRLPSTHPCQEQTPFFQHNGNTKRNAFPAAP